MSIIEFTDVTYRYRTQPTEEYALESVSCQIDREEFVGISGPSDAGKSTFARFIPSYIPNFFRGKMDGTVTINGVNVQETTIGELATVAGLLFENPFNQLTGASTSVLEEVAFGLENLGLPEEEILERTYDSLERVGIAELIDRNPQQLSGGQSQRLALASLLAMKPDILVLDEPTSQLDPSGTEEVMEVISEMDEEGFTVVMISQDLERMAPHLDRLFVFDEGKLVDEGSASEILKRESSREPRIQIPAMTKVGNHLRNTGVIPETDPLPLSLGESVEELRPYVDKDESLQPQSRGTSSLDESTIEANPHANIAFDSVSFSYNEDIQALRDISVELDKGCICVIGQNGAGKSTFAKHLNGLLKPSTGSVEILGRDTREHRVAQLAADVGLSFQNPDDQLFRSNVEKEVRYGPQNLGYNRETIDRLANEAIERLGLEVVREKNPYDLGQPRRKRVAVASVYAMDTPIVVLDEPTGGQDAYGQRLLGDLVDHLVSEGKLVITITHDMEFVSNHATRILVMGNAEILMDGDPRTVFGRPDILAETDVDPPAVTRMGQRLGLSKTVLHHEELLEFVTT